MNIYGKLQKVRARLHQMPLKKTGNNNGKPFFELEDFMPAAIQLMDEIGLCGVVSFTQEFATLTIFDTETECTPIIITSPFGKAELRGCHEVQNIGAVETYQRRYVWVAGLDIMEHDGVDDDAKAAGQGHPEDVYLIRISNAGNVDEVRAIRAEAMEAFKAQGNAQAFSQVDTAAKSKRAQLEKTPS